MNVLMLSLSKNSWKPMLFKELLPFLIRVQSYYLFPRYAKNGLSTLSKAKVL